MNFRLPNHPQRCFLGTANVHHQTHDQVRQIEAAVESVGECAKVVVGVLAISERLVSAGEHRLVVAQDGVDPLELRQMPQLALADDFHAMRAAGVSYRPEACQAVAPGFDTKCWNSVSATAEVQRDQQLSIEAA